jgi:ATP-dependent Clp protease ATP-binding subunit ClpB
VISESDLDRDAIASAVAMKVAFGNVPENLRNKRVFRLSLDVLASGARTSEEFVIRLQSVLAEAAQAQGRIILFVDQLQEYAGARAATNGDSVRKGSHRSKSFADHWRRVARGPYASYIAPIRA